MFRCITELKGIAVDIDSFQTFDAKDWVKISSIVPCVFLTTSEETEKSLVLLFGTERVIKLANVACAKQTHTSKGSDVLRYREHRAGIFIL